MAKLKDFSYTISIKHHGKVIQEATLIDRGKVRTWLLDYSQLDPRSKDRIRKHLRSMSYNTGNQWKRYGEFFIRILRTSSRAGFSDIEKAKMVMRKDKNETSGVIDLKEPIYYVSWENGARIIKKVFPLFYNKSELAPEEDEDCSFREKVLMVLSRIRSSGMHWKEFLDRISAGITWKEDGVTFWCRESIAYERSLTQAKTDKHESTTGHVQGGGNRHPGQR